MSSTVVAQAILGIRLTPEQVYEPVYEKTFDHDHPITWKVDPVSGRPLWRPAMRLRAPFRYQPHEDPDNIYLGVRKVHAGGGMIPCEHTDSGIYEGYYVGIGRAEVVGWRAERADFCEIPTVSFGEEVQELQRDLEAYGLWDPSRFGLWSVLYWS